jgi:hypothetical protein
VREITRLFCDSEIKIAFHKQKTIKNILKPHTQTGKYKRIGIYQIKCLDCPLKYIGQTGRIFNIRYKEHIQAIRNNNSNSGYSNHILNTGHTCGIITDIMEIVKTVKKGRHLNTLEKYHVYRISKDNLHMNDTYIDIHNPIFETLSELNTR